MNVLVLNGPNLNWLGRRDPAIYGTKTLAEIERDLEPLARELGATLEWFQSNHEGALIDRIQERGDWADGALANAGALTHTSHALADALRDFGKPVIEVHLSDLSRREKWRRTSVFETVRAGLVQGHGPDSYRLGLEALVRELSS